jgi:hypothetical protein
LGTESQKPRAIQPTQTTRFMPYLPPPIDMAPQKRIPLALERTSKTRRRWQKAASDPFAALLLCLSKTGAGKVSRVVDKISKDRQDFKVET